MNDLYGLINSGLPRPGAFGLALIGKTTLVLLGAGIFSWALRKSSSEIRHGVWTLAMMATLTLPILSALLPAWSCAVVPIPTDQAAPRTTDSGVSRGVNPIGLRQRVEWHVNAPDATVLNAVANTEARPLGADSPVAGDSRAIRSSWNAWNLIVGLWGLGAFVVLSGPLAGRFILSRSLRRARRLERGDAVSLKDELAARLGLRRRVDLYRGRRGQMPLTWGWFRSVILIPAEFEDWSFERRRYVLLHELAHVRRFDCLTQTLAQLACSLYWFNPLAWFAARRMTIERERASDDLVLTLGGRASAYAESLLEIATMVQAGRAVSVAAVAMARPSLLETRLRAILDPDRPRTSLDRRRAALALLSMMLALFPFSAFRLAARAESRFDDGPAGTSTKAAEAELQRVEGRVLAPDGTPIAGAAVDLYGRPRSPWQGDLWNYSEIEFLGHVRTDQEGRFQANVPRSWLNRIYEIRVLAGAERYGAVDTAIKPEG